jgi:hypothetical protein
VLVTVAATGPGRLATVTETETVTVTLVALMIIGSAAILPYE